MVPIGGLSEYAKSGLPTAVKGIHIHPEHLQTVGFYYLRPSMDLLCSSIKSVLLQSRGESVPSLPFI